MKSDMYIEIHEDKWDTRSYREVRFQVLSSQNTRRSACETSARPQKTSTKSRSLQDGMSWIFWDIERFWKDFGNWRTYMKPHFRIWNGSYGETSDISKVIKPKSPSNNKGIPPLWFQLRVFTMWNLTVPLHEEGYQNKYWRGMPIQQVINHHCVTTKTPQKPVWPKHLSYTNMFQTTNAIFHGLQFETKSITFHFHLKSQTNSTSATFAKLDLRWKRFFIRQSTKQ